MRSAQVAFAKAVRAEVLAQPVPEPVLAEHHLELPHDDRRLLIDDGAVERAGFVEVVEALADRVRSGGAIDLVGGRIVGEQEPQLVVDLGK